MKPHSFLVIGLILASPLYVAANQVPNPTVTAAARAFNASFTAVNLFDSGTAEYATASQGAVSTPFTTDVNDGTWVEFDFGSAVTLDQFVMVTRNNNVDVIGTSRLIVSSDAVFDTSDTIFTFDGTGANAAGIIQNVGPVSGRYARWEVLTRTGSGLNLGSRQMYFLNIPSGQVLLPAPTAINSSTPYDASFAASLAVNGNAGDGSGNEYASQGIGANMFVDFDFGASVPISGFDFWNRVVDRVTTFNLIFSDTADFSSPIATLPFTASANGNQINSGTFAPVTARYVRFQTTGATGGLNTGMREIQFYTTTGQPPIIVQPGPQGGTRLVGDSFTFMVFAGGDPPRYYQWWRNGLPIDGATNASLTLTNLQIPDAGTFWVVVSNIFGTATSNPAELNVIDPAVDITSDLRAWFKMDDGTFLTAADSSGNGNNGTLQGFPDDDSQWVTGRIEGGLRFNPLGSGINEVVLVPDNGQLDFSANPEFTVAAWVRAGGAQEDGAGLLAKGVGGGGEQYAVDIFGGAFRFFVRNAGGAAIVAQGPVRANGTWQHVVAVYSRSLDRMKLYVNTLEVGSSAPFSTTLLAHQHELSIGARKNTASVNYDLNLNGVVDDVRVYARALTPNDVAALYAEAVPTGPTIVQPPQDTFAGVGSAATFTVIVDGTVPLSYQWRKGGVAIAGATNETLTVMNAQLSDDTNYSVVIVNAHGTVTSAEAHLSVVPFLDLRLASGQASSIFSTSFSPSGAFDGLKLSTGPNTARWASAPSGAPHWIYVDLGGDLAIRRVAVDYDPACASSSSLRVRSETQGPSSNPDEWTSIATVDRYAQAGQGIDGPDVFFDFLRSQVTMPGNTSADVTASINANVAVARYLMLHVSATAPPHNHVSVWEFQVDAVSAAARIHSVVPDFGCAIVTFTGIPRLLYEIQQATDITGSWSTVMSIAPAEDGVATHRHAPSPQSSAFYRIVAP